MALANIYRVVQDLAGNVVTDVLGTVTLSGTSTLAALFADAAGTVPLPNPVVNNSTYGSFSLFVAAGSYDMQFVKAGFTFETQNNIVLRDPASGVNTLTGTPNQVLVSPASGIGAVTLSLPQNIDPDASLQFGHLGLGTPAPSAGTRLQVNDSSYLNGPVGIQRVPSGTLSLEVQFASRFFSNLTVDGTLNATSVQAVGGSLTNLSRLDVTGIAPVTDLLTVHDLQGGLLRVGSVQGTFMLGLELQPLTVTGSISEYRGLQISSVGPDIVAEALYLNMSTGSVLRHNVFVAGNAPNYFAGAVGIGATPPGYLLHCNGSAGTPGGAWINSTSRAVLKQHIRPLEDGLRLLAQLRPREWEWAENQPHLEDTMPGTQTGFVVEDVALVYPAWTPPDAHGTPGLAMRGLEAYLVRAIQQLLARLEALEAP